MLKASTIKNARESVGETQNQFGERFGVDQSTIHRWETDGPPTKGPGYRAIQNEIARIEAQRRAEAAE